MKADATKTKGFVGTDINFVLGKNVNKPRCLETRFIVVVTQASTEWLIETKFLAVYKIFMFQHRYISKTHLGWMDYSGLYQYIYRQYLKNMLIYSDSFRKR